MVFMLLIELSPFIQIKGQIQPSQQPIYFAEIVLRRN